MPHLNIRMTPDDECNLGLLKNAWNMDKTEITRKALALAASQIAKQRPLSKEELLRNSQFIGSDKSEGFSSTNYKDKLKLSLTKKHEIRE